MKNLKPAQDFVKILTRINLEDMHSSLGIKSFFIKGLLYPLFSYPARSFARVMKRFNTRVDQKGLKAGADWLLGRFHQSWSLTGSVTVPKKGPLLVVSNHPGMTDTLGLFAVIERLDLKILAAARPFLVSLTALKDKLILVPENGGMSALRPALEHLKSGGALLTFPAGQIEPDPELDPKGAREARSRWSASTRLFEKLVPGLPVLRAEVRGVIAPQSRKPFFLQFQRDSEAREKMAAVIQLMTMVFRPQSCRLSPQVEFFP